MIDLPPSKQARIFISYKRSTQFDEPLAREVYQHLSQNHDVFIDRSMIVGADWGREIEDHLGKSDYLIVFLSKDAVQSEMVRGEIEIARRLAQEHSGKPKILPVRVAYHDPLQYPLSAYLDSIQWALWESDDDTPRLIAELLKAIGGEANLPSPATTPADATEEMPAPTALAQPLLLDMPEGTIDPNSNFYIERSTDQDALKAIKRQDGATITIIGSRQMGKSSLLIRMIKAAKAEGKRVAYLDFQIFDKTALSDTDVFFRQFCVWLSDELDLKDQTADYWNLGIPNAMKCGRYVSKYLLKELNCPLVLAMDEVDTIFETDLSTGFFSMLRSWHNERAREQVWKQLDIVLVTSTEPYQFIKNLNQSPFNVGENIKLLDFTSDQVADLNRRHGSLLNTAQQKKIMELLNGHPYLVRRALYLVGVGRTSFDELLADAINDRGPFGDHLRYHLFRLNGKDDLIQGLRQIIRHHNCQDEEVFFRLSGAGLARREGGAELPRCQLYADYFQEYLHV